MAEKKHKGLEPGRPLTEEEWEAIRVRYENNELCPRIAEDFGIRPERIRYRARNKGWLRDKERMEEHQMDLEFEQRQAMAQRRQELIEAAEAEACKAAGVENTQALILEDAKKLAAVKQRHREEPTAIRERLYVALKAHREATTPANKRLAFEDLKAAKIASEIMLNLHKLERQAWGMTDEEDGGGNVVVQVEYIDSKTKLIEHEG